MYFVIGLARSFSVNNIVWVIIDRLTKSAVIKTTLPLDWLEKLYVPATSRDSDVNCF